MTLEDVEGGFKINLWVISKFNFKNYKFQHILGIYFKKFLPHNNL